LAVVAIALVIVVVAAGAWVKSRVYADEPAKITAVAKRMCGYELPKSFRPRFGLDMGIVRMAVFTATEDGDVVAMVYFMDWSLSDCAQPMIAQASAFEIGMSKGLGIDHPEQKTVTIKSLGTVPFEGTNTMQRYERIVYFEEDDIAITAYQGVFPRGDRTVLACYMAIGTTNSAANGKQFLDRLRPAPAD